MRRRGLTVADRGPGWSYRPGEDPGDRQPGISTPRLDFAEVAAFDVPGDPGGALRRWRAGALAPATVTIGLGPSARLGPERPRPVALRELPPFEGDALDPAWCGGDVVLQVCAPSAEGAAAALAALTASAPEARERWRQPRRLRRGPGDRAEGTPRDPLGFRDGSGNLRRGRDLDRHV